MGLFAADVNGDSVVNIQDLVLVASRFGETGENETDVNDDGVVNIQDLVLVAGAFGESAASPAYKNGARVLEPIFEGPDIEPPRFTGGTVLDGTEDVDPAELNEGGIEITFSEEVTGNIALQTEGGSDVGWVAKFLGKTVRLETLKGKEIDYETSYVIKGTVSDGAGNETDIDITFTTGSRVLSVAMENLLDNLVAHWSFERDSDWILDYSGNGNDGRIIGQPRLIDGMFRRALQFDFHSENDAVVVPDAAAFGEKNITLTGWFTSYGVATNRTLIVKKGSFAVGFTNNAELQFVVQPNDTSVKSVSRFWLGGEWYHFAVTYDGKTMKVYINGELENEQPNAIPIAQSEADLVIGKGFDGGIDEVGFYNRALTEDEIVILMEEGYFW